ncbi:MAG: tRNA guanosine(34) transglycosylase Tgt [Candidatus Peribacteraceae bacterium]|nr:tRNA guanosine(34) transglycosylase Tgt [Candidatus Peribacteraceae bacterium]
MYTLLKESDLGRCGELHTRHGTLQTPFFMPVGTAGAMKGLTLEDLEMLGAEILLCNTYHLHIRPGEDVVQEAGGLHGFVGWDKPILTDSGGFQVFSLESLRKISDKGVAFNSHLDGTPLFLGAEEAMTIQHKLGADIIMCFDHCPPSTASRGDIEAAVDRTLRWAAEGKRVHERLCNKRVTPSPVEGRHAATVHGSTKLTMTRFPLLFGIVQGGLHRDLRKKCAEELIAIGFDGYAVGGLAVGESADEMYGVLDDVCPLLPKDAPRYLMGVGRIEQMEQAVAKGIDMFDCVLPMREARHGTIYLSNGEKVRILNNRYVRDHSFIDPNSPSPFSRTHKKSYLNHLLRSGERLGETIACAQNMAVTLSSIRRLRERIQDGAK